MLLLNTEVAYWNLYNKYGQLYSAESNLRVIHKVWQETYNRCGLNSVQYGPHNRRSKLKARFRLA